MVIPLVAEGMTNARIAREIGTTTYMVMNYLKEIYDAVGMSSRLELALWYVKRQHERTA